MAWLKAGDTAAMDERVLNIAALGDADERSVNEVFGFVMRLFLQAAQQETDYRVSMGTAMVLSPRYEVLLEQASRTGLLRVVVEEGLKVIHLVADEEFLHMRSREEIEWEKLRRADVATPQLTVPVRLRDGDACRYCGCVVSFGMRKGGRGGTYDHLKPGRPAQTEHELVVACRACNGGRREAAGNRDKLYPLLPPPPNDDVYLSKSTIAWLEGHGTILAQLGLAIPKRTRGAKDLKPGAQTRTDVQPRPGGTEAHDGAGDAATAHSGEQRPAAPSTRSADAAPQPSGEQRAEQAQGATAGPDLDVHQRADRSDEPTAPATSPTGQGTRAETGSEDRSADAGSNQVASQRTSKPDPTSTEARSADSADEQAAGSGFPGTGRDGSGRAGPGRDGTARDAGPRQQGGGDRRRKRGRRRRGKR